jgi:phage repressor protein C with HTH and peptisase S24 domain
MKDLQLEQRKWLAHQLEKKGRGGRTALAQHLGVRNDAVTRMTNFEGKEGREISFEELIGMAEFFKEEPPGLNRNVSIMTDANPGDNAKSFIATKSSHVTIADVADASVGVIPGNELVGNADLPVFGTKQGGRGALIVSNQAVDWVVRPAPLLRVAEGYGMIMTGDSMSPAVKSGWTVLVNPHLPPRPGDVCVFRSHQDDGTVLAIVKELVRYNDVTWHVHQHNPKRDIVLKRSEWKDCHVTVGNYSR